MKHSERIQFSAVLIKFMLILLNTNSLAQGNRYRAHGEDLSSHIINPRLIKSYIYFILLPDVLIAISILEENKSIARILRIL